MLVFMDESGDSGFKFDRGSSPYFTICAVIFPDGFSADACDRNIDELRLRLKLARGHEFHFKGCRDSIKRRFLSHVSSDQFRYHAFVIDKQRLLSTRLRDDDAEFYSFAVGIV